MIRDALLSLRAAAATVGVVYRAGCRALPDAAVAAYCDGLMAGVRTWERLVMLDLDTLAAVDDAIVEALLTGKVREEVRR